MSHNLPSRLTSFVGREREIAEVGALLEAQRLVTLAGAPGVGKTRLSLQIAKTMLDAFRDGVWLVELAPLGDPELVPQAVADVLGVRDQPGRPLTATLADHLRSRQVLLLLDNCEHLIGAVAALADMLLQACPRLHILTTSREPLAIEGEITRRVPSLTLPDTVRSPAGGSDEADGIAHSEAVRLFVDRARAAAPSFTLTEKNAPIVAQICERLDGIPLALELAAARVHAFSLEQIAARLDDRFRLLTGGSRTALPRQQTLRGAVDWSYNLLSQPEQRLVRRLAVFAGGFTLEAAEQVGSWQREGGSGDQSPENLSPDCPLPAHLLVSLVDKSLVQVDEAADGERRYRLLETLREYGLEKLAEHGELAPTRSRHRDYFLAFGEAMGAQAFSVGQADVLRRLEREHDNLRAALACCQDEAQSGEAGGATSSTDRASSNSVLGLRLAGALFRFWHLRGHISEGHRWLPQALGAPLPDDSPASKSARAHALMGVADLSAFQGDYRGALPGMESAQALWEEIGDERQVSFALQRMAY